jgi:hypothetical protein
LLLLFRRQAQHRKARCLQRVGVIRGIQRRLRQQRVVFGVRQACDRIRNREVDFFRRSRFQTVLCVKVVQRILRRVGSLSCE